jgi:hypothetical protein
MISVVHVDEVAGRVGLLHRIDTLDRDPVAAGVPHVLADVERGAVGLRGRRCDAGGEADHRRECGRAAHHRCQLLDSVHCRSPVFVGVRP